MTNYLNTTFVKSVSSINDAPGNKLPEVLLCGRSNVGKSSFINAICNNKSLAFTSSKPGHTRLLNYYLVDNKFYFVDAPGYGYAQGGIDLDKLFYTLMDEYFTNPNLKLILVLLDSRRNLSDNDIDLIEYLIKNNISYYVVFTKVDKLNQSDKAKLNKHIEEVGITAKCFYTSSIKKESFAQLKESIDNLIK